MRRQLDIRSNNGQTIVEFALILPILCVLLFGVIQFGILFNNYVTLTDAVRAGARKAAVSRPLGASGAISAAQQAVRDAATDLDPSKLPDATVTSSWDHGEPVTVCAKYPYAITIALLGITAASGNLTSCTKERVE
jgi:Flp pilus assembly protein TadG